MSNNNNSLFSVQPAITPTGTLSFTPAPDMDGVAVVTVSLSDDGSGVAPNVNTSPQQTFNITVTPSINNPPVFTKGADQTDNEDDGAQSISNWATAIDDGDPEAIQTLTFNVSNNNNALVQRSASYLSDGYTNVYACSKCEWHLPCDGDVE